MDTRTRILNAARELYLEGGHRSVTMRGVAERVSLTATALYRHFDDKNALMSEVVNEGFRMFASYLYKSLEGPDPRARLRLSGEAYLRFGLEQPEFYRTIFMGERDQVGPPKDFDTSATFRFLVDRVAECIEAGFLRRESAEDIALTIWAHSHGLVSLFIAGSLPTTQEEFQRTYGRSLGYLIEGLRV